MIKYFLLSLLFIASPAFAVLDGNMGDYKQTADRLMIQNVAYLTMIIVHLIMIVFTCDAWLKHRSVKIKLLLFLATVTWTGIIYNAYIEISSLLLYMLLILFFLIIKYSLKSVNKDNPDKWLKLTLFYILLLSIVSIVVVHEVYAPAEIPTYYEL